MRTLREDQNDALNYLRASIARGNRRIIMKGPTGFGKTILAAQIVANARAKDKRVLFTVPRIDLIDQTIEKFAEHGIHDIGVIQAQHEMTDWSQPVQVASVQTLQRRTIPQADLVLIDEVHIWHKFYEKWFLDPVWANIPIIGLSATPWTKGLGAYFQDMIIASTTQELIDAGHLSQFRVFAPSHPDLSGVRTVAGDYVEDELSHVMQDKALVADIVATWMDKGRGLPTLCFAVNRDHAAVLVERFQTAGVKVAYQDAFTKKDERRQIARDFANGDVEIAVSIGTLTTGIDWDARCVILARPTKSDMLFCLDSETEILTSHGWRGIGDVKTGDCVATMSDITTGAGQWSRVVGYVERNMENTESWVEYDGPRSNFRVTDQHTMIAHSVNEKEGAYRRVTAIEMAAFKGGAVMPTAIHINQPGVPLTDAELYFIGMMMTDGTWTATSGSISQSERHPEVIERIEKCLADCGIAYSKTKEATPPLGADITEKHVRWRYSISTGKPKPHGNQGRGPLPTRRAWKIVPGVTGFRHLLPFMDKDFSPALMALSRSQFLVLLQGIHDGDGFKLKSPSVDWTPRSWALCSSRKIFVDRLQALASINGFTAHGRREHSDRENPIWYVTITPQDWRQCGGYNSPGRGERPQIEVRPATQERVWCIETETGTIVTRRRGKVTVMGNCQMIGRALRTAEGKDYALILDHTDTHLRMGFVTDVDAKHTGLHDGKTKTGVDKTIEERITLPKECPSCGALKPPKMKKCLNCGAETNHVVSIEEKLKEGQGELAELKQKKKDNKDWPAEKKAQFLAELSLYAKQKGYAQGWSANKYREKFSVWPNRVPEISASEVSPETLSWIRSRNIAWAKSKRRQAA